MGALRDQLQKAPRQMLAIGLILMIGAGYSLYRAAAAFSPQEPVPEYQRTASPAFAIPDTVGIVDPAKVNEDRLPDAAYEQIIPQANRLAAALAEGRLTAESLTRAGASSEDSNGALTLIRSLTAQLSNLSTREVAVEPDLLFSDISSDAASVSATVSYGASEQGDPPATLELLMQFEREREGWRLQGVSASL